MAFYDKFIPKELKKGVDELLDFGSSAVEKGITKPFASASDKLLPNELRFLAPYAAGIGTLMLPPGMNMFARAALASLMNAGGQIAADESATGELGDLNKLSMAIAGGLGALGAKDVTTGGESATGIREGIEGGLPKGMSPGESMARFGTPDGPSVGFMQGAENLGREGIAQASDYIQGTRSSLADIGKDPKSLFKYDKTANILKGESKLPGVTKAAGALLPTATLGTADVAYEAAIDAQNLFNETEAEELRQAGASLDEIQNARRVAIREAMESAQFTEQDILDTLAEIGLKDGGIASLKNGGILGFNDGGRVGFADGDHVKKNLGYREREGDSMPMPMPMPMPMGLGIPPSGNYADNFSNQSSKTLTVDNSNPYSNDKRRENVIQAMMAAKHSQATIDEALGELGLKNGGIIGLKDGGMLDLGGNEMDYRGGGFIPMGSKERADDVPARLSKNEFVMTADAVRAAGGGSVNKGAQRMYDIMNRLEAQV